MRRLGKGWISSGRLEFQREVGRARAIRDPTELLAFMPTIETVRFNMTGWGSMKLMLPALSAVEDPLIAFEFVSGPMSVPIPDQLA